MKPAETIQRTTVSVYEVPTDFPESDGTLEWNSTTMVLVELTAGRTRGIGYTYAHASCAAVVQDKLFPLVQQGDAMNLRATWNRMNNAVRNFGRQGLAATAIAAVDIALWDLKARLLGLPLVDLLGAVREKIPVYGSGGFTSYPEKRLRRQFEQWIAEGITMVKMKVGRDPAADGARAKAARKAIDRGTELFVDANGAYSTKQALEKAEAFSEHNVSWFEEPVSSDDLDGLQFIRGRAPAGMEISAGEYNYDVLQARRMLETRSVDVLQADATRCGITGFLQTAGLCDAFQVPLSSHTASAIHAHLGCAASRARHAEYFHDHVRIEQMFFNGATTRHDGGFLKPDRSQPGLGLEFKRNDAEKFRI
ncbi:MAG TPA: enolase C-terminal domain-like protein [Desulfuromonadaceae bacterium]|nr:enolase C-terminal domain-like protein [Desulfuromonadaceae bacterium]